MLHENIIVRLDVNNDDHGKKLLKIFRSDSDWLVMDKNDTSRPDLIIYETDPEKEEDLKAIENIIKSNEADEVFITSGKVDTSTLMHLMRIGVKEFIPQPINTEELEKTLGRFKERRAISGKETIKKSGQIISVLGGKGGVGTTTIAVNLAVSIQKLEKNLNVALLDMNTLFGEIPLFLEITPKFHWGEITNNIDRLDNTFLMNVLTRHLSGVHLLPSPAYLNGHQSPTPDTIGRLLDLMKTMFDYVVIDLGQSTDETALKVLQLSDSVMLISIPSLPCLANTNRLMKSLVDLGYITEDRIKIILNRFMKKNEISLEDVKTAINRELFWVIPNDYRSTMSAINNGKPLAEIAPNSNISNSLMELAATIIPSRAAKEKKRKPFLNFFQMLLAKPDSYDY